MISKNPIMSRRRWLQSAASLTAFALLSNVLSACGGSSAGEAEDSVTKLELGCNGDELAYDKNSLSAPAGAKIELLFTNRSHHHQHNWVLVNGGEEEAMAVYQSALVTGIDNDWLPPDSAQVLTHTPLVDSGQSATVSFQAPTKPGTYSYLCTFPGHFLAGMKGTLTVT